MLMLWGKGVGIGFPDTSTSAPVCVLRSDSNNSLIVADLPHLPHTSAKKYEENSSNLRLYGD
jgi:hypothetical protein